MSCKYQIIIINVTTTNTKCISGIAESQRSCKPQKHDRVSSRKTSQDHPNDIKPYIDSLGFDIWPLKVPRPLITSRWSCIPQAMSSEKCRVKWTHVEKEGNMNPKPKPIGLTKNVDYKTFWTMYFFYHRFVLTFARKLELQKSFKTLALLNQQLAFSTSTCCSVFSQLGLAWG